ncbi:hypothetical protein [Paenibacillus senegalimassiliensis]|uniref:hypothetical protein n=1 Tax=Paenibacillus senegalimassiliensis TaxID=1737426 RepID=UPI00073EC32D|nr:hypothetical protein [Paenibacillus senegalimassiliensis]
MAVPGLHEDDLALIKSALLLECLQRIFQRDARVLEQSGVLKSPDVYVDFIRHGESRASVVLAEIHGQFRQRNIEIYRISQDEHGIRAEYRCRGFHGKMNIFWSALQQEVSERMRAYLSGSGETPTRSRARRT